MNAMHWRSPDGIQTQGVLTSGNMLGGNGNSTVETRYGKAIWTAIVTPTMLNEFRFGWFKDRLSDPACVAACGPPPAVWDCSSAPARPRRGCRPIPARYPSEQRFQIVDNYQRGPTARNCQGRRRLTPPLEDWIEPAR